jgi:penicillin-insensitive murein endopeptidase
VHAQAKDNPWARVSAPSTGEASPIGEYTSGCLRGASQLPLDGPGYQVMHPGRLRYFGHPELVTFIQQLGQAIRGEKLGDLMVGDLSQPRGGPAPGGHSSHQTGLDVDLWFWQPPAAARGPLPRADRDSTKARSVLDPKTSTIKADESARTLSLLRLTATDTHVARIFVHPIIKRDACKAAGTADRSWLHKLRPWFGHDDHFHVRLECPPNAVDCVVQSPVPQGDGCGELDWWFSPEAQADRAKGQAKYQAKVGKAPGMPKLCATLLDKPVPVPVAHADERAAAPAKPGLQAATATAAATATTP